MNQDKAFRTAARYMGGKSAGDAETLRPLLERALPLLEENMRPMSRFLLLPARAQGEDFFLAALPPVRSLQLCRLFHGATQALTMALTLGGEIDVLLRRLMLTQPALGAAAGALASALADQALDDALLAWQLASLPPGKALSPRFSPGYGDLPLSWQKPLTEVMECWRIGVRLTQTCMMLPEKSITALCALRDAKEPCQEKIAGEHACGRCAMTGCPYREIDGDDGDGRGFTPAP